MASLGSLSNHFHDQLGRTQSPWMSIQGLHKAKVPADPCQRHVVDFDIKVDCSELRHLTSIEIRKGEDTRWFAIDVSDSGQADVLNRSMTEQWYRRLLDESSISQERNINFEHVIMDMDQSVVPARIRTLAKQVAYGGRVNVIFHDLTSCATTTAHGAIEDTPDPVRQRAFIRANWSIQWPSLILTGDPSQHNDVESQLVKWRKRWISRIQHAMVDQKYGWISQNDQIPPGIPFMRALREKNLISEVLPTQVYSEGQTGGFKFNTWGSDE